MRTISVVKDLVLTLGGLAGITYQTITGQVNIPLLITFTAMAGVPGVSGLVSAIHGSRIESRSSSPVSPSSSSESADA